MSDSQTEVHASTKPSFRQFIGGEFGLPLTFWGYGVAVNVFFYLALLIALEATNINIAFGVLGLMFAYLILVIVANWRAADKYAGHKVWPILVLLGLLLTYFPLMFIVWLVILVGFNISV